MSSTMTHLKYSDFISPYPLSCIGDDMKAAVRESPNCIKKTKIIKYGEKRFSIWRTFGPIQWHVIPEAHATLHGAVTWRNQCLDHATLQGVRIPSVILKIVFHHILFFCFLKCSLGFDKRRLSYRLRYTCFFVDTVYTT